MNSKQTSEIPFFDCNMRIGVSNHPDTSRVSSPEELLEQMEYYGIERALVWHKECLNSPLKGNRMLLQLCENRPAFVPCAVLAPAYSGEFGDIAAYVSSLAAAGVGAVRLFPAVHNYPLRALYLDSILDGAQKHGLPVLLDEIDINRPELPFSTWNYSPSYEDIYELCQAWPALSFVVIAPGMLTQRKLYTLLQKCPRLYVECSSFGYRNIEFICREFSAERLVFGSYFPLMEPGAFISCLMYADIPEEDKRKIAFENLNSLLAANGKTGQEGAVWTP